MTLRGSSMRDMTARKTAKTRAKAQSGGVGDPNGKTIPTGFHSERPDEIEDEPDQLDPDLLSSGLPSKPRRVTEMEDPDIECPDAPPPGWCE